MATVYGLQEITKKSCLWGGLSMNIENTSLKKALIAYTSVGIESRLFGW